MMAAENVNGAVGIVPAEGQRGEIAVALDVGHQLVIDALGHEVSVDIRRAHVPGRRHAQAVGRHAFEQLVQPV